jgi:hypothetical protein
VYGLDDPLPTPIIAQGASYHPHGAFQRGSANELVWPYLGTQFILPQHAVAVLDQVQEQLPGFGT